MTYNKIISNFFLTTNRGPVINTNEINLSVIHVHNTKRRKMLLLLCLFRFQAENDETHGYVTSNLLNWPFSLPTTWPLEVEFALLCPLGSYAVVLSSNLIYLVGVPWLSYCVAYVFGSYVIGYSSNLNYKL